MNKTNVLPIVILPGGKMPERKSRGAEGYDAFVRVVTNGTFDDHVLGGRRSTWDFGDPSFKHYVLRPGGRVIVGLGFIIDLGNNLDPELNWSFTVELRGSAVISGLRNAIAGVPVDSDFRGEPIAVLEHSNVATDSFVLTHNERLVQLVFSGPSGLRFPVFRPVHSYDELSMTGRGFACNGSTR